MVEGGVPRLPLFTRDFAPSPSLVSCHHGPGSGSVGVVRRNGVFVDHRHPDPTQPYPSQNLQLTYTPNRNTSRTWVP